MRPAGVLIWSRGLLSVGLVLAVGCSTGPGPPPEAGSTESTTRPTFADLGLPDRPVSDPFVGDGFAFGRADRDHRAMAEALVVDPFVVRAESRGAYTEATGQRVAHVTSLSLARDGFGRAETLDTYAAALAEAWPSASSPALVLRLDLLVVLIDGPGASDVLNAVRSAIDDRRAGSPVPFTPIRPVVASDVFIEVPGLRFAAWSPEDTADPDGTLAESEAGEPLQAPDWLTVGNLERRLLAVGPEQVGEVLAAEVTADATRSVEDLEAAVAGSVAEAADGRVGFVVGNVVVLARGPDVELLAGLVETWDIALDELRDAA